MKNIITHPMSNLLRNFLLTSLLLSAVTGFGAGTVTVHFQTSTGAPIVGVIPQYNNGSIFTPMSSATDAAGNATMVVPNPTTQFRILYTNNQQTSATIVTSTNPTVTFYTTNVTLNLVDHLGNPITSTGSVATFTTGFVTAASFGSTTLGTVSKELLPGPYEFSLNYNFYNQSTGHAPYMTVPGGTAGSTFNYTFQTALVTLNLVDCNTLPITTGSATATFYGSSGYNTFGSGTTSGGTIATEMLPGSGYFFRLNYNAGVLTNTATVSPGTNTVNFQTTNVTFPTATTSFYLNGSYTSFSPTVGLSLLPGTYFFRINGAGSGVPKVITSGCSQSFNNAPCTAPAIGVTGDCFGEILTAPTGNSYTWSPGAATTQTISATAVGIYSVGVTYDFGCTGGASPTVVYTTSVTFPTPLTITASPSTNGSVAPAGVTSLCAGGSQAYTITPAAGYHVAGVLVDGSSVGAVTSYPFSSVSANHTIGATFAPDCVTPDAITGPLSVSTGTTISLGETTSGGTWTSTNGTVAAVGMTGVVSGLSAGTTTISYTVSPGCGVAVTITDADAPGAALNFNGTNTYVVKSPSTAMITFPLTVEAWVRPIVRSDGSSISDYPNNAVSDDNPGNYGHGFGATILSNGASGITVEYHPGFQYISYPMVSGQWYHISTVYTYGNVKTYVGSTLIDDHSFSQSSPFVGANLINIGKHNDDGGYGSRRFFKGDIDEVRIWNRALCLDEITSHMNCELVTPATGLMAYYKFNEGTAFGSNPTVTTAFDASGNGNDATLNNFTLSGSSANWVTPGGVTTGVACVDYAFGNIAITGNSNAISDASTTTSTSNNTDFGNIIISPGTPLSYTINNTGSGSFTVSSIDIAGSSVYTVSGISFPAIVPAGGSATFTITFAPTVTGTQNATVTVNNSTCEPGYVFAITGNGVCIAPSVPTVAADHSSICTTGTAQLSIASGVLHNAANWQWYTGSCGGTPAGTGTTINVTPAGTTTYYVRGTGGCVSAGTCGSITITVNTPVAITCPGNVVHSSDPGVCNAIVTYSPATATGTSPLITYSQNSGTTFPIGVTTVTATATNICTTDATCSFTVTVNDNELPAANCKNVDVYLSGTTTITAADINNVSTDNCTPSGSLGLSLGASQTSFSCADVSAPVNVILTVTDASLNSSTCPATVTVHDDVNPVAHCHNVDIYLSGTTTITAADINNASTDNCTPSGSLGLSLGASPTSFSCANVGAPVGVTLTITDASLNTNTCPATVTVHDDVNPTITAPSNVTINGWCRPVSLSDAGASLGSPVTDDNCGIASVANDAPSVFPIGTTTVTWTVTDVHGNTATATQTVTVNTGSLTLTPTTVNTSCNGGDNGSISIGTTGGAGILTYSWTPAVSTSAIASGLYAGSYAVTVTDAHTCTASATQTVTEPAAATTTYGTELIVNSTFEDGLNGFSTAYINNPTSLQDAGTYDVSVATHHTLFQPGDHTTGSGKAMWVNGYSDVTTPILVWSETADVTPGTNYSFAAWVKAIGVLPTPTLRFFINGVELGTDFTIPDADDNIPYGGGGFASPWEQFSAIWHSGAATSAVITIYDDNSASSGNDFGLDDISFRSVSTTTLAVSATATNVSCNPANGGNSSNGTIGLTVTGATDGSRSYSWTPSVPSANAAPATGLTAGIYSVTVTDGNGCIGTASATVDQPTAITYTSITATNISCNNSNGGTHNDATATVNGATGGTGELSYLWSDAQTTNPATGLIGTATYNVTITDNNNCTATGSATVDQPTAITYTSVTATNISCNNSNDGTHNNGTATVNGATGGTGELSYLWSDAQTTNPATGLIGTATYNVTITDNNNCTATASATVDQPTAITYTSVTATNISCNNSNDGTHNNGTATVNGATGGTGELNYLWSNAQTTNPATGLTGTATYNVTITDNNNCTATGSATVDQPTAITYTSVTATNISCNNSNDGTHNNGTATVNGATGGTGELSYLWSDAQTTNPATGLTGTATYNVTITDNNNCTATGSATVDQPTAITYNSVTATNISCNNSNGGTHNDGTATVNGATGGTGELNYLWSNAQTTNPATGLTGTATYNVTITDNNNCTATGSATVDQPTAITYNSVTATNISCNNSNGGTHNDGTATVNGATGGTGELSYLWSDAQTTNPATGLIGTATYNVTITDNNNCSATGSATVDQPTAITYTSVTATNISCNNSNDGTHNNGTATVNGATGGTGELSYLWSNAQTTNPATGLIGTATYNVTVTDNNNCTATGSATVDQPTVITYTSVTATNISCNNSNDGTHNNGTATVNGATGGTGELSYLWSNAQTTNPATGLIGTATYNVTITDNNNCTATGSATVDQPTAITYTSVTATNISCNNSNGGTHNDGTATVNGATGGTGELSYLWSNAQTTNPATGLTGTATYNVTITDNNNCTATGSATVDQPTAITYTSVTATNISCNNSNGGTHNDGTATVNGATGGTGELGYLWSNAQTTNPATGLTGTATYNVTITDTHNCTTTGSTSVGQPAVVSYTSVTATNISCNNSNGGNHNNGAATVNGPTGGTAPLTYLWSDPSAQTTNPAIGLTGPATYYVTIRDAHNCTTTGSASVGQPSALVYSTHVDNINCNGGYDGFIDADVSGGTWPYFYNWNTGGAGFALYDDLYFAPAGTYTVTATDWHGCTLTAAYTITQPAALTLSGTTTNVSCHGGSDGGINTTVGGGVAPYSYYWSGGAHGADPAGLSSGTYYLTVIDAHGCSISGFYTITQPSSMGITASAVNVSCNGGNNGSINTTVVGGTPGYTYLWSNSSTAADPASLVAGTYSVVVTDAHSCTVSASYTVTQPAVLSVGGTINNVSCYGGSNGAVTTSVSGGTASYHYLWSPGGATTPNLTGKVSGTYNVTVTDGHGCTAVGSFNVTQPLAPLSVSAAVTNISCYGGNNGSITPSVGGGTPSYTYAWSPCGISTPSLTCRTVGTYNVTVTDAHGCTTSGSYNIAQPSAALSVAGTVTNESCNGGNSGSIRTSVTGGTSGYTYLWSPGSATTSSLSGKTAGAYGVTVTDAHGCTAAGSYTIAQPAAMSCAITVTPCSTMYTGGVPTTIYLGYGPQSATLTATAAGGSGFTYLWSSTGGTTNLNNTHIQAPVFTATLPGKHTYVVTITNSNGCVSTCTVSICVIDAVDHSHSGHILFCHGYGCTPATLSLTPADVATHCASHGASDHIGPVGSGCGTSARESGEEEQHEVVNELTVNAYPNPFASEVHLKIQSNLTGNADITVYDMTGRIMETKPSQPIDTEITLGGSLAPGIYIVEVKEGGEVKKVKVVRY